VFGQDGKMHAFQGPNSAHVKFGKTICQKCNNKISKPWDQAYDHFIEYVEDNPDYFRNKHEFDWHDLFQNTDLDQRDLARYYIKNFGCRMIDHGMEVPESLRHFLFDDAAIPHFDLVLFRDYHFYDRQDKYGWKKVLMPYANSGTISDYNNKITGFTAVLQDGCIGVYFNWCHQDDYRLPNQLYSFGNNGSLWERSNIPIPELWSDMFKVEEAIDIAMMRNAMIADKEALERDEQALEELRSETEPATIQGCWKQFKLTIRRTLLEAKESELEQRILRFEQTYGIKWGNLTNSAKNVAKMGKK
jgi:hypothetical protein